MNKLIYRHGYSPDMPLSFPLEIKREEEESLWVTSMEFILENGNITVIFHCPENY